MIFGWSAMNFTSWVIFGPKMADFWTKNDQKFTNNDFFEKNWNLEFLVQVTILQNFRLI